MPTKSRNTFEVALEYVSQGVVIYDEDLVVIGFNRRALEILEIPPDQVCVGKPFSDWVRYAAEHGGYGGERSSTERFEQRMEIIERFESYQVH